MNGEQIAQHESWKAVRARMGIASAGWVRVARPATAFGMARARVIDLSRDLPPAIARRPVLKRAVRRALWTRNVRWRDCAVDGRPSQAVTDARRACIRLVRDATGWPVRLLTLRLELSLGVVKRALEEGRP